MDIAHKSPKTLVVPAAHGDGKPPKTLDARYVKDIMHYFDNPEKTPFNYIMGVLSTTDTTLRTLGVCFTGNKYGTIL